MTFNNTTIRIHCNNQNVSIVLRKFRIGRITWSQRCWCHLKENHEILLLVIIWNSLTCIYLCSDKIITPTIHKLKNALSIDFENYSFHFRCCCNTIILISTGINERLNFRLNMSYNFTHWCGWWICFDSWPATTIYVSELKSPRDLHHKLVKLNDCSFAVKTTH